MSDSWRGSKFISSLICLVVYIIAFAGACISLSFFINDFNLLIVTFIADVIATVIVFLFSTIFKNASLYDPYWSVAPPVLVLYWAIKSSNEISVVNWIFVVLTFLWSIRLTLNWWRGWRGLNHEDWRYVQLRKQNQKLYPLINFAGIHLFPTIMVFICSVSFYVAIKDQWNEINLLILSGAIVCLSSIAISLIADEQMASFRKKNLSGESMKTGLWKYSRHPNYLGEILFWWGGWLMAMGVDTGFYLFAFGPMALTCMFIFISIPMIEKHNIEKRKSYQEVIESIPMLFPFFKFDKN